MKDKHNTRYKCPDCGVIVSDLHRHKKRNRCKAVYIRRFMRGNKK